MSTLNTTETNQLIEYQWTKNDQLSNKNQQLEQAIKIMTNQNKQLTSDNPELQKTIQDITNSKGWRLLNKARKIIHR